jgi:RNA polymerase sigma factor (sigma-70 family)
LGDPFTRCERPVLTATPCDALPLPANRPKRDEKIYGSDELKYVALDLGAPSPAGALTAARGSSSNAEKSAPSRATRREDALDIAQDAYVRFLKYEGAIGIDSPPAMLFRIAGNVASDHVRAAAFRRGLRSVDADDYELASDQPSAERELSAEQNLTVLRHAIEALPPRCRTVFLLSRLGRVRVF